MTPGSSEPFVTRWWENGSLAIAVLYHRTFSRPDPELWQYHRRTPRSASLCQHDENTRSSRPFRRYARANGKRQASSPSGLSRIYCRHIPAPRSFRFGTRSYCGSLLCDRCRIYATQHTAAKTPAPGPVSLSVQSPLILSHRVGNHYYYSHFGGHTL